VTITLRPYQANDYGRIRQAWEQSAANVLYRLDTGGGKSALLGYDLAQHPEPSCLMAHRQELVSQLSIMLGRYGVRHDLIASASVRKAVARAHMQELGTCFYQPGARTAIASVDTLIRAEGLDAWARQVTRVTVDEAHHLVRDNKWCRAVSLFTHPNRKMLLPTATPKRADGKGLGSHADGYADVMVQGPPMRWLIDQGFLTDYKIVCPPSDLQILEDVGASGDWSSKQLREAAQKSRIVGDMVMHYLRWAIGMRTLCFCTDVDTAAETATAFQAAGVRAATLTGKTQDDVRRYLIHQLERGELDVICAVDIISEGFDLPAVECVIMGRPTASLALYMQQFGRALRLLQGKLWALVIDAVGNVVRHMGPPDRPREWTLDRRDKRAKSEDDPIPVRVCLECFTPYERFRRACPVCGHQPLPQGRSLPAQVDGDLAMLDAETLARLRGDMVDVGLSDAAVRERQVLRGSPYPDSNVKSYARQREAQIALRGSMAQWGGVQHARGYADDEIQRIFFLTFGIDTLSAQSLHATEAFELKERIDATVNRL
jgi:DNA repair protein RadD